MKTNFKKLLMRYANINKNFAIRNKHKMQLIIPKWSQWYKTGSTKFGEAVKVPKRIFYVH